MRGDITPVVITFNEAPNIGRVLARLTWAKEVLIVDSGSTDETLPIVAGFPNARVVTRSFDTFAGQCNFALTQVTTPWVLSMDSDYVLSEALVAEIEALDLDTPLAGYEAAFRYQIGETVLRGSLYPPRTVLYRKDAARYADFGHGHKVEIEGSVGHLSNVIYHDDRKPYARWLASQKKYAKREADYLRSTPRDQLGTTDKIRLAVFLAPVLAPIYALIVKGALFDGPGGWEYARQRLIAECAISTELLRRRKT